MLKAITLRMPVPKIMKFGGVATYFPGIEFQSGVDDRAAVFVKSNHEDIYGPEVVGLDALRATNTIRVVDVVGSGVSENGEFVLVLKAILPKANQEMTRDFFQRFARQLADMHRAGGSELFGFEQDNFLGASHQPNPWNKNWTEFWIQSRLGYQLQVAKDNRLGGTCLLYTSPSPRDRQKSRMPSSA